MCVLRKSQNPVDPMEEVNWVGVAPASGFCCSPRDA